MDHMAAIRSGEITQTTVIGLRKAYNADTRRQYGLSVSSTAPTLTHEQLQKIGRALHAYEPRVVGKLHDTGLQLLRNKRYRKRLIPVSAIIDTIQSFHLVDFHWCPGGLHCTPLYRARSGKGLGSFVFYNIPWQSGGDGPQVILVED